MSDKTGYQGAGLCDPNKATQCSKSICHVNGGKCYYTTREEWLKDGEFNRIANKYLRELRKK